MKTVSLDHTTTPHGEDVGRVVKDKRRRLGSKRGDVEPNLFPLVGRELPVGGAECKVTTARPQGVLTRLDLATVDKIDSRPCVEHKPPHLALTMAFAWLD
jgi:hypothetical protein